MEEGRTRKLGLRQRVLAWLRYRGPSDMQQVSGRAQLVAHFHEVRKRDVLPVLVIQGVPGSGKGRLIRHLQAGYRRRVSWWVGLSVDARLDLTEAGSRTVETGLASLRDQLRSRRPFWRRMTAIVLTPRFAMMQARLWRHRIRIGAVVAQGQAVDDVVSLAKTAKTVTVIRAAIKHGTLPLVPLVPLSPRAGLLRFLRLGWERLGASTASRWVRSEVRRIEATSVRGPRDQFTTAELQRGLSRAMAEDLAAASRRRWLGFVEGVVFVDGYDLTESEAEVAHSWVADFADDLHRVGAPVMLVLGCRQQRVWSQRLRRDPERFQAPRELGLFDGSPTVEVHTLNELPADACLYELMHQGVPESLARQLVRLSGGHPLALNLLGMLFGSARDGPMRDASPEAETMLSELRDLLEEHSRGVFDEAWVKRFCAIVAPSLSMGLSERLEWHARAAATLRSFDRDLLAHVMGSDFRGEVFDELVRTPLVVSPRPSTLLRRRGEADGAAYRVRSFLREFWAGAEAEPEWTQRWNLAAAERFERLAARTIDDDHRFALAAEALFHRLCIDQNAATDNFRAAFFAALEHGRFDHCEAFIALARDIRTEDRSWGAGIEEMAGRSCYGAGNYVLAEECFRAAKRLAEQEPEETELLIRAAQGLASCERMRGRFEAAEQEVDLVLARSEEHHVARFQGVWTASLIARDRGRLTKADVLAHDAAVMLQPLLNGGNGHREEAQALGLNHLKRKPAHLLRHRAEIARRAGRYGDCAQLLQAAHEAYRADPEPEAEMLLDVVRAHLLRLEGRSTEAIGVASATNAALSGDDRVKPRSTLMASRSLAQALLAGGRPEDARGLLDALAEVNADDHPIAVIIARYGLGELARLRGDVNVARKQYQEARAGADGCGVLERVYGHLGLIELEREASQIERSCELFEALDMANVAELPLLAFWANLVGARAFASVRSGFFSGRRASRLLHRAEAALGVVEVNRDHALRGAFVQTTEAIAGSNPFEPISLLLP